MEQNTFKVVNDKGEEVTCHILFTFDSEETKKSYIVYTDDSKDEQGNIQVYASVFHPDDPNTKLEEIETEKEWKVIETILETLQEEVKNQSEKKEEETQE